MSVGKDCDVELSVHYGSQIGNYACAGRATQQLDARSVPTSECLRCFSGSQLYMNEEACS